MESREEILNIEGRVFPGKTYTRAVLLPAYEQAKSNLLDHMISVNKAHLIMLQECSLIDKETAVGIMRAIVHVDYSAIRSSAYTGQFEDLFFRVEHDIMELVGDAGGALHLARSRNDMGVTMYRMALREKLIQVCEDICEIQKTILRLAKEHTSTIMLAYTHTQQAQPTTFSHYLLAIFDSLGRDFRRLMNAYVTCNRSPLGAAALTTTGFSIDRYRVAELLGFEGIVENSYDAIGGADYLAEAASALGTLFIGLGRYVQDLLLLSTQEFNAVRVADPYVQISSIMPQKRNPVSLEHIRALSSSGLGNTATVMQMLHNTPFGDIVDTEDDLQPYIWRGADVAKEILGLLNVVMGTLDVNKELLLERAKGSFASVTELADMLVRELRVPFRTAHQITSESVKVAISLGLRGDQMTAEIVNEASKRLTGRQLNVPDSLVQDALNPVNFVAVRSVPGGPASQEIQRALESRKNELDENISAIETIQGRLDTVQQYLDMTSDTWGQP